MKLVIGLIILFTYVINKEESTPPEILSPIFTSEIQCWFIDFYDRLKSNGCILSMQLSIGH